MFRRRDVETLHARAARSIERPELTLKDLRHVSAIAWVKGGVHIRLVQRWLGHTSLSQTMKYTDYEPNAETESELAERAAATLARTMDVTPLTPLRRVAGDSSVYS
jgi:integrase